MKICLFLIAVYRRVISPLIAPSCRFQPTCSEYAAEAVARYGIVSGTVLSVKRVLRCHPWGGSGYDPLPGMMKSEECQFPAVEPPKVRTNRQGRL